MCYSKGVAEKDGKANLDQRYFIQCHKQCLRLRPSLATH